MILFQPGFSKFSRSPNFSSRPNFSLAVAAGVQTLVWQSRDTRATVINRYFIGLFGRPYLRAIKDLRRQKYSEAKLLPTLEGFKLSYGPQSDFLIDTFCRCFVA